MPAITFVIGERVADYGERLPSPMVIVVRLATSAEEWITDGGTTVVRTNPGYPADAPVVVVVGVADSDTYFAQ